MPPAFQTVRRERLYEQIASQIEALIRSGELADGDVLPSERELQERFEVGRATVRDALLSLQQRGLVVVSNGERARVTKPKADRLVASLTGAVQIYLSDEKGVRDFQGLRSILEIALVRLAATQADRAQLDRIDAALRDNERALGDPEAFGRTDVAFHLAIAEVARNGLIFEGYRALNGWLTEQRARVLEKKRVEQAAFAAHRSLRDAIRDRDPDRAEREMRAHLDMVAAHYWEARNAG